MIEPEPLVTVVTPSYNYGRFIGACVASVRDQTYPRIEHIVMDACSTDDTAEVLATFGGGAAPLVVTEKDGGQADALNKGFAMAQGEIFCWLNADDYWLHDRVVEEAIAAMTAGVDLAAGAGAYVSEAGERLMPIHLDPARAIAEMDTYSTLLQPATFWRRGVHHELRTDLHYAFDWRFFLDVRASAREAVVLDREWAAYRWHGENKSAVDPALRRKEIADILRQERGVLSPHHLWARTVSVSYWLDETAHIPVMRWGVQKVNAKIRERIGLEQGRP